MKHFAAVVFLALVIVSASCTKKNVMQTGEAGLESGQAGLRIVANYDPRFDSILERYRLLTITFANQSPNLIELDAQQDIWTLYTRGGTPVRAINNLRFVDPKAWNSLPTRAQDLIEYPRLVIRNTTVSFDLFFPKSVDLQGFQKIDFYCQSMKQNFVGGSGYGEIP